MKKDGSGKRIIAVFSGYNMRGVVSFLRSLASNEIDDYCIIAIGEDPILNTQYKDKVVYVREDISLNISNMIKITDKIKTATGAEEIVIAPSTEGLIRFVLDNREVLEGMGCVIPLVDRDLYIRISDKLSFYRLCRDHGLPVPDTFDLPDTFDIPFVAKTRCYTQRNGRKVAPVLVTDREEYDLFRESCNVGDYFYEEYIEGESIYLLYYISRDKKVICFSQRNLIQLKGGGSMIAAECADYHNTEIADRYEKMLIDEGFFGIIMIELRINERGCYMIEANPRFWGPSQLFVDAHVPIFEAFLMDMGFIDSVTETGIDDTVKYYWSTGIRDIEINDTSCIMHRSSDRFISEIGRYRKYDIYNRPDTINIFIEEAKEKYGEILTGLYEKAGKHSGYQRLPDEIAKIITTGTAYDRRRDRHERERLDYILRYVDVNHKLIADVGGNTGFFTFELSKLGGNVEYYEGNPDHAEFVRIASELYREDIRVYDRYFDFEKTGRSYDIILCLNVLHHLGADFGRAEDISHVKEEIAASVNAIAARCKYLVFQLGFNWMGDVQNCLFENGTKREMIDYVRENMSDKWDILHMGVPVRSEGGISYMNLNDNNIERDDSLGEFLNRPIFIMRSKLR